MAHDHAPPHHLGKHTITSTQIWQKGLVHLHLETKPVWFGCRAETFVRSITLGVLTVPQNTISAASSVDPARLSWLDLAGPGRRWTPHHICPTSHTPPARREVARGRDWSVEGVGQPTEVLVGNCVTIF
ncbi:hypothetical protein QAD02_021077 [Eretmocerus hayati]|uniref:Uncharacterized protein n=1 Tax=Eretmocerus hayati TaxID=131215 RepID=A0ACC2PNX1_9HYME|nr:hypothetical protein QAD02_021077 [Eretmocerus hayati]